MFDVMRQCCPCTCDLNNCQDPVETRTTNDDECVSFKSAFDSCEEVEKYCDDEELEECCPETCRNRPVVYKEVEEEEEEEEEEEKEEFFGCQNDDVCLQNRWHDV